MEQAWGSVSIRKESRVSAVGLGSESLALCSGERDYNKKLNTVCINSNATWSDSNSKDLKEFTARTSKCLLAPFYQGGNGGRKRRNDLLRSYGRSGTRTQSSQVSIEGHTHKAKTVWLRTNQDLKLIICTGLGV